MKLLAHSELLVDKGVSKAIEMIESALLALGSSSGDNSWSFPHIETRDLAGRIFGKLEKFKYNPTKNIYQYISDNYRPATNGIAVTVTSATALKEGDVLYYCDLSRLNKVVTNDGAAGEQTTSYQSTTDDRETWDLDDYNSCKSTSVTFATLKGATLASTTNLNPAPVDVIDLWDVTMVHELTHAVVPNSEAVSSASRVVATTDHGGTSQAYGWYNIYRLRQDLAFNADSLAYFAMGAQQLTQGNRINSDGSMSQVGTGDVDLSNNQNVMVDNTWAPVRMRKRGDHGHREMHPHLKPRALSTNTGSTNTTSRGTASKLITSTVSKNTVSKTSTISKSSSSSSRPLNGTHVSKSTSILGTGVSKSKTVSSTGISKSSTLITSTSHTSSTTSSLSSGTHVSQSISVSSNSITTHLPTSTSKTSSTSHSGTASSSVSSFTSTVITRTVSGTTTVVSTSVPVKPTSSSSSSVDDDYIWLPTFTPAPSRTLTLPVWVAGNTESSSSISIFSATGLYIPTITDIKAFPTVQVKDPNPTDKNNIPIVPFVKVTLPKDKCSPIPKPSGGGILGLAFHFASDIVNGVLDSACHIVFPVVLDGTTAITGTLPAFVALNMFPLVATFPESPGDDGEDDNDTKTSTTRSSTSTSSSSSSSSCSASGVAHCTSTCAVSKNPAGTATSSCGQVCTTVTTCSGTATTTFSASTITGSVTPLSFNEDTPFTSEWYVEQDSLLADLIANAPSTLDAGVLSSLATQTAWAASDGFGTTLATSTSRNLTSSKPSTITSIPSSTTSVQPSTTSTSVQPSTTSTSVQPSTTSTSVQPSTTSTPTGPTGFHVVALRCDKNCDDALEIVPSGQDGCSTIAQNQQKWWGAAFPHPAEDHTESNNFQIPPFDLLQKSNDFDVLYVFDNDFSAELCGLPKLNFTFTQTSASQWTWLNTDNNSGTCYDNTAATASTCTYNGETYTAQELLVCVQPNNPTYCGSVSV
ncbi:hypothetical protein ACMFMF_009514 [Clarireedia jacksonii]